MPLAAIQIYNYTFFGGFKPPTLSFVFVTVFLQGLVANNIQVSRKYSYFKEVEIRCIFRGGGNNKCPFHGKVPFLENLAPRPRNVAAPLLTPLRRDVYNVLFALV